MIQLLRRKQVASALGIGRHALARLIATDRTFPRFFAVSPGVEVITAEDFNAWIEQKRVAARVARIAP